MCIRDSGKVLHLLHLAELDHDDVDVTGTGAVGQFLPRGQDCLLYTSDAADERSSVDLGGRRIIKKKKDMK